MRTPFGHSPVQDFLCLDGGGTIRSAGGADRVDAAVQDDGEHHDPDGSPDQVSPVVLQEDSTERERCDDDHEEHLPEGQGQADEVPDGLVELAHQIPGPTASGLDVGLERHGHGDVEVQHLTLDVRQERRHDAPPFR